MREDTSGAALAGRVAGAWALGRWRAYERRGSDSTGLGAFQATRPMPKRPPAEAKPGAR